MFKKVLMMKFSNIFFSQGRDKIYLIVNNPITNFQISNSNVCSNKSNLIIKLKAAKDDKSFIN